MKSKREFVVILKREGGKKGLMFLACSSPNLLHKIAVKTTDSLYKIQLTTE